MRRVLGIGAVTLLFLSGCYRATTRNVVLSLPPGTTVEELRQIRRTMLEEQDRLRSARLISSIQVREVPPALLVAYDARHLGVRNLEQRVRELGHAVNGLPPMPGTTE